jgi:hypothetical protein
VASVDQGQRLWQHSIEPDLQVQVLFNTRYERGTTRSIGDAAAPGCSASDEKAHVLKQEGPAVRPGPLSRGGEREVAR